MGTGAHRGAGRIFAALIGIGLLGAGAATAATPDFTGKWLTPGFVATLKTTQGKLPPLRPEAKALYDKRVADRAAGRKTGDPVDDCVPHGVPRLMYAPYPMLIVQDAKDVAIIQQANHTVRMIYINGVHPEDGDPKWLGHSTARWEGQTLVVDTVQFNDKTWLDKAGLPHSDQLKVTERFKLLPGGKTLQDRITIDDPKTYTAPWSTAVTFNRVPGMALAEQVCSRVHKM